MVRWLLSFIIILVSLNVLARGGGGCFLPHTPILKSDGSTEAISDIKVGDQLKAYDLNDQIVTTKVYKIIKHIVHTYYVVNTVNHSIQVTGEHPFYIGHGNFKTIAALRPGDKIYILSKDTLSAQVIQSIQKIDAVATVYNLKTAEPHTYFASGIAVHNKGGGGGRSSESGGGSSFDGFSFSDEPKPFTLRGVLFFLGLILVIGAFNYWKEMRSKLDFIYSRRVIERKSEKTLKLLEFLAKQDTTLKPDALKSHIYMIFLELNKCWQARDYAPMKSLLMPDLYALHEQQILGMIRNHEINCIARLQIQTIDFVNIRYSEKKNLREFTVLITASARDYYIDDRTRSYIRGDEVVEIFQEFWTFQWHHSEWLLRDIEQTNESDYLKEENFIEQFTDGQIEKIYGESVNKLGNKGPGLSKEIESKANKAERMLNFLAENDPLWNRQNMLNQVRVIFGSFHLALEAGELNQGTESLLFPEIAEQFKQNMQTWQATGQSIEYRNFCVRKVDILLIKHFNDKSQNEFTARINAHAQRVLLQNGRVILKDDDVRFFREYWTFGCLDKRWKLKAMLPEHHEESLLRTENIEEDTSLDMIKWYYSKKRV